MVLNLVVEPLHQIPPFRNIGAGLVVVTIGVADVDGRVEAEAVYMVFVDPQHYIVANVIAHLGTTEIRTWTEPRVSPPVVVEIDSVSSILKPAIDST